MFQIGQMIYLSGCQMLIYVLCKLCKVSAINMISTTLESMFSGHPCLARTNVYSIHNTYQSIQANPPPPPHTHAYNFVKLYFRGHLLFLVHRQSIT